MGSGLLDKALQYAPRLLGAALTGGTSELGRAALEMASQALGVKKEDVPQVVSNPTPEQLQVLKDTEVRFKRLELEAIQEKNRADQAGVDSLNQRINDHEGTAKDLAQMPILGRFMLFVRGSQRPVWSIFCMIMDYQLMSGGWTLPETEGNEYVAIVWLINLLVLSFLFGERAVKNLTPLILDILARRRAG